MQYLVTQKTEAEVTKLKAEIRKLNTEIFWHPVAVSSGLIVAVVTATIACLKMLGLL